MRSFPGVIHPPSLSPCSRLAAACCLALGLTVSSAWAGGAGGGGAAPLGLPAYGAGGGSGHGGGQGGHGEHYSGVTGDPGMGGSANAGGRGTNAADDGAAADAASINGSRGGTAAGAPVDVGGSGGVGAAGANGALSAAYGGGGGGGADGTQTCSFGPLDGTGWPGGNAAAGGGGGGGGGGAGAWISSSGGSCSVGNATGGAGGTALGAGGAGGGGAGIYVTGNDALAALGSYTVQGGPGGDANTGMAGAGGDGVHLQGNGSRLYGVNTNISAGASGTGARLPAATGVGIRATGSNVQLLLYGTTVVANGVRMQGAGGELHGNPTITGGTVANGAEIQPGNGSSAVFTTDTIEMRGGRYAADVEHTSQPLGNSDLIDVTSAAGPSADVTGATLRVEIFNRGALAVGNTYTLMRTAPGGSITGTFTLDTSSLPRRVTAVLDQDGSTVVLRITDINAAPPPATPAATTGIPTLSEWGLAALSLLLAAGTLWQRRRVKL